ncbi:ArnT family glycosyltransferase [Flavobacterium sp. '19STA2R22 D10 B1']|uniref:ArnT family glycosyltransferase n=1 Tax=Flavobacterium aerium TaxID=3037261 RepID=UPI00278C2C0F|nr:glycosyltransferase 87 family protein [Flavobacterium sp. '19STA2R22 D10 B1']
MIKNIHLNTGLIILLSITIVAFLVNFTLYPFVGYDSGYYLSIIREVYHGKVYFTDIAIPYNPLSILLIGIPQLFSEHPDFRFHLLVNIITIIASAGIFYKILGYYNKDWRLKTIFSLLYVAISLTLDGNHLMLEPLSIFFQLLGLLFYLQYRNTARFQNLWITGFCIGLSFLAKQYGLFILLPIGVDILLRKKHILKETFSIGITLLLPILLLWIYYITKGVSLSEFIHYILGKGVHFDVGVGTGVDQKLSFSTFKHTIYRNPYILLVPILFFFNYKKITKENYFIILLPIASFSVLLLAAYDHYFQYIIPYYLLLFVYAISIIDKKKWNLIILLILIFTTIRIMSMGYKQFRNNEIEFNTQKKEVQIIKALVPEQSEVYLDGVSPALYYLCDFKSIQLKKIGFTFPGYFYPETIINNMNSGAYLIVSEEHQSQYDVFLQQAIKTPLTLNDKKFFIYKKQ